ncbi:MAG: hypothetical protein AAGB24_16080 [Bacteroidota bacterium]
MKWISEDFLEKNVTYGTLMEQLKSAFKKNRIQCPSKLTYTYKGMPEAGDNTFLFMPAWDNEGFFGTKLITTTTANKKTDAPYIQGIYILFDAKTGVPLVAMDAKLMTNLRTAVTSALAASFLAKKESRTLLVLGNGNLSIYFIRAHTSIRKYQKILLWGRRKSISIGIAQQLKAEGIDVTVLTDYKPVTHEADIISCITSSHEPLLMEKDLQKGQHLDLVGSFTPEMLEVTTDIIANASVYVDNLDTTPHHCGELVQAIKEKKISEDHIKGDLTYLCSDNDTKRRSPSEITVFKSTGMALEDFITAQLVYQKLNETRE